jgi:cobyrinic acid a,c-diamide synthase
MGQSVAALVKGFAEFDKDVHIAGVILNKLGSLRHVTMMEQALDQIGMPVVGAIPRFDEMVLPSRHLGLVQATESSETDTQIDRIADHVEAHISVDRIAGIASSFTLDDFCPSEGIPPLGQHIAVAEDDAFRFFYPHLKRGWSEAQANLSFFSPLNDEAPDESADAIYLPGGYPELHAGRLAASDNFMKGLRTAACEGKVIYGECGGYMTLGSGLVDKDGVWHQMADLLPLETSFAKRKLHLGYRHVKRADGKVFRGHEFHYASIAREEGEALYEDVDGSSRYGLQKDTVSGSFVHLIDAA